MLEVEMYAQRRKRRIFLYITNSVSAIGGIVFICLGTIYMFTYSPFAAILILQKRIRIMMPLLMILFGLVVSMKSLAGLFCTFFENSEFESVVGIIALCILSYVFGGVLIKLRRTSFKIAIKNAMSRLWGQRDTKAVAHYWNSLQIKFKCCGLLDWRDWSRLPDSCGANKERGCLKAVTEFAETLMWSHWHEFCGNVLYYMPYVLAILVIKDIVLIYYIIDAD